MYLLNAQEVAQAMTNAPSNGGRNCGPSDISGYAPVLNQITSRLEGILEVGSLSRRLTVDYFRLDASRNRELRLSNAFLLPTETALITDLEDGLYHFDYLDVDTKYGIVRGESRSGVVKVAYTSGFNVDEQGIFVDVPEWLKSIAIFALVNHYRLTSHASAHAENVSYGELQQATVKEMYTRATKAWHRPRVGMAFPYRSLSNGD